MEKLIKKIAILLILALTFNAIAHIGILAYHSFVTGLNPFLGLLLLLLLLLIIIPIAILTARWFSNYCKGKITFTPSAFFAMGSFIFLTANFFDDLFLGHSELDFQLQNISIVAPLAHNHILLALLFGIIAVIYYVYPKIFRRHLNTSLGYIHFWITLIGAYLICWPVHYAGLAGMPRRYIDYEDSPYTVFTDIDRFIGKTEFILLIAQVLFLTNLLRSARSGKKLNPHLGGIRE